MDAVHAIEPATSSKQWIPRRVLITPEALQWEHGRAMAERCAHLGCEIQELKSNRLTGLSDGSTANAYANAKTTLAIVTAPPGSRALQPIPPSADWQFHIAKGCPAHCQYCYLAGSLSGAPVTRAFANLPEILNGLRAYEGRGTVTSQSKARADEGTTFEASCYTDPLAIEHLTGSLRECIRFFGAWDRAVQLRWTTKFDGVQSLLDLPHGRKTRVRFSVSAREPVRRFEGGTASLPARLGALRRMALAGYPVGLTIAPIMPVEGWQTQYRELLQAVSETVGSVPALDLTAEFITHRFTPKSKLILIDWYPKTPLEMDETARARKITKFGSAKFVYRAPVMREMRQWFDSAMAELLPCARVLYWT